MSYLPFFSFFLPSSFSFLYSSSLHHLGFSFSTFNRLPSVRLPWSRARLESSRCDSFPQWGEKSPELLGQGPQLGLFIMGQGIVLGITVTATRMTGVRLGSVSSVPYYAFMVEN